MRRPELDYLLTTMLDSQPEVSDLVSTGVVSTDAASTGVASTGCLRQAFRNRLFGSVSGLIVGKSTDCVLPVT